MDRPYACLSSFSVTLYGEHLLKPAWRGQQAFENSRGAHRRLSQHQI